MPHRYTDWHPPMMAFLWHYLDMLVRGPILMLVMQSLLWWGGWLLIVRLFIRSPFPAATAILIIGLWPATGGAMGTILKDMQMAAAYLCAVGLLLTYRNSGPALCLWVGYALLFYGTGVRHNAIVAAVPILIWSGVGHYCRMQNRPGIQRMLLAVVPCVIVIIGPALFNRAITSRNGRVYVQQMLFVYDLGALSTKTNQLLIPEFMLTRPVTVDEIRSRYTPISAVPLIFSEDPIIRQTKDAKAVKELQKAWFAAVRRFPEIYLRHRLDMFRLHLWFGKTLPLLLPEGKIANNELGFKWDPSNMAQTYWKSMQAMETRLTYLFRPWVYCALGVFFLTYSAAAVLRRRLFTPRHAGMLAMSSSGVLYILSYFPLSISAGYRYSLWTMITTFLCLLMLPGAVGKKPETCVPQSA